jgi:hypothetical protein
VRPTVNGARRIFLSAGGRFAVQRRSEDRAVRLSHPAREPMPNGLCHPLGSANFSVPYAKAMVTHREKYGATGVRWTIIDDLGGDKPL